MNYALQVRDDARLAGRVLRYHTWPHIKQQSVAEHSWQLLRILLCIWPNAPRNVLAYVVRHDCGELTTGDAPYPVKADNPILGNEMNRVEKEGLDMQIERGFLLDSPDISETERWVVKLAEFIEMWEWGLEEQLLGNQFAKLVAQRCIKVVWTRISTDARMTFKAGSAALQLAVAERARDYVNRRTSIWPI